MNTSINFEGLTAPVTQPEPTGGDLDYSFERDGVQLDMSGYDIAKQTSYYAVFKAGDTKPSDIVRIQPSGKVISIIDTLKERGRNRKAGWQSSVFKRSEETDTEWVGLTEAEVQEVFSSNFKDYRRAKKDASRRAYSADTKRLVREARESGSSWSAIANQYGVPVGTARRWVEEAW